MEELTLRHGSGGLVIRGLGEPTAVLHPSASMRRGKIKTSAGTLPIEVNDPWRSGATLTGTGGRPILRLDPRASSLPDSRQPAQWQVRRGWGGYSATLSRGGDRIELRLPRLHGKGVQLQVTGRWGTQLELILLAACFALLARRRGDTFRAMAVVGATGHGH